MSEKLDRSSAGFVQMGRSQQTATPLTDILVLLSFFVGGILRAELIVHRRVPRKTIGKGGDSP